MPTFSAPQITEINEIISRIEKAMTPKAEIGACDKATLNSLLKTIKVNGKPAFFACKREYSEIIINHFVKEKGLVKNRFHRNNQQEVFLLKISE